MRIAVIGTGYVGLTTGVFLAEIGHHVTCVDVDSEKISMLLKGKSPIYEPGIEEVLNKALQSDRIRFTTSIDDAINRSGTSVVFVGVGTPTVNGKVDMSYVRDVCESISKRARGPKFVVIKSTVPVGTYKKAKEWLGWKHAVISNPEFLREGQALKDCRSPDRIVVGCDLSLVGLMNQIYHNQKSKIIFCSNATAELSKYASNTMLATKISLMNEIAKLCDDVGADIVDIEKIVGSDSRIGPHFIKAGVGWGGSCFPKDIEGLIQMGETYAARQTVAEAVFASNEFHKSFIVDKIMMRDPDYLSDKKYLVIGLAFKEGTDDMRDAPSLDIVRDILAQGGSVVAYDPLALHNARKIFGSSIDYVENWIDGTAGVHGIVLINNELKEKDLAIAGPNMKEKVIWDGRNSLDREQVEGLGFEYYGIGRGQCDFT